MTKVFNIGDTIYMADYLREQQQVTCPDCGGTRHVTVVLHDGTNIVIDCAGCDPGGCEGPQGHIVQFKYQVATRKHTVSSITVSKAPEPVEYRLDRHRGHSYVGYGYNVFATEVEAIAYGETLKQAIQDEENKRLMAKTKDHRTWAWNASYHRKAAKRLREELKYHEAKAIVCQKKGKGGGHGESVEDQ